VTQGTVVGKSREERFRGAEQRILAVSRLMDDLVTVPGTGRRFGLDPIIGLIPVIGDGIGGLVGAHLIAEAARFGVPRVVLARMILNTTVDMVIGIIPFVGDIFDFFSKSNANNLALFRRYALEPGASTQEHRFFFAGLALILIGILWLAWVVMTWLIGLLLAPFGL
jgi:Domain of unknown function (DUF4112)